MANDLTWATERTRPLNLEKHKISFILFYEILNIFRGTDCKHYTFIRHKISCLHSRHRVVSSLRYESSLLKTENNLLIV